MKIGIDASRYSHNESTGVECYSFHIINALLEIFSKSADEVVLYSKEPLNIKVLNESGGKIQNKVLPSKRFWTLLRLTREMKQFPPDVLFVPSHTLPLSLPKKNIIMIHDVAFRHFKSSYSPVQYHYLNWSTKFAVKNASNILTPSRATKNDLISFFNCPASKIEIINHGFSPPSFSPEKIENAFSTSDLFSFFNINKTFPFFLFVGRIESKKNLVFLVRAFFEFSKKFPDYKLVLAGKRGVGFRQILSEVQKLNLSKKIIMTGYVEELEKVALFKYCKGFLFPSLYEGFGFPVLEAFYYNKPVICSDAGSLPEVAGDSCFYVGQDQVFEMASLMRNIAQNDSSVKTVVEKAGERVKMFKWSDAARKTYEIIVN